jgi:prephenate dehydrogenase
MAVVALLGYGRFGAAFAALLEEEAGATVRAYDPFASVPGGRRAPSLEAAVAGADFVAVAVPVAEVRGVVRLMRPYLTPAQLVFDVASVKVHPEEALAEELGSAVPWVATHPLFGPVSLALAERPLRVVVCPNAVHPTAAARARALYESIGCEILEQSAHAHDRAMAETHALAFFVAKGIVDAAMGANVPYAPPSFQAIRRTVDVVRSDAGHLFTAIQRENPYAGPARKRLLDAMLNVDRTLEGLEPLDASAAAGAAATGKPPSLSIPDLGAASPLLQETRQHIDALDAELLRLLGRRMELARRALRAKAELGQGTHDPGREAQLLAARRAAAAEAGLDEDGVEDVFRAILRFSKRVQVAGGGSP